MLTKQVHHINGAGEDAGVVYSEMQARENQSGDLMALRWAAQSFKVHTNVPFQAAEGSLFQAISVSKRDRRAYG